MLFSFLLGLRQRDCIKSSRKTIASKRKYARKKKTTMHEIPSSASDARHYTTIQVTERNTEDKTQQARNRKTSTQTLTNFIAFRFRHLTNVGRNSGRGSFWRCCCSRSPSQTSPPTEGIGEGRIFISRAQLRVRIN